LAIYDGFLVVLGEKSNAFDSFLGGVTQVFCEMFGHRCESRHTMKTLKKPRKNLGFFDVRALAVIRKS